MRSAAAAIEQTREAEEQRPGADANQRVGGANGGLQPTNDCGAILVDGFVIYPAAPIGWQLVDIAKHDHNRVVRKRLGQRLNGMQANTDRRTDGARDTNTVDTEVDRILLVVGAAEHIERPTEIEKRDAWRKDGD